MRFRVFAAATLLILGLAGCGPVYRTTYHFSLPESQRGRECVNACRATQQQCESAAEASHQQCLNRAERSYQACESRKKYEPDPKKGWKNPVCVENCVDCSRPYCAKESSHCEERYRECFVTCGGTVETTVECTSNCEGAR